MKDAVVFTDTVPPIILRTALKASGFRLRGFHFFRHFRWPRINLGNILSVFQAGFLYASQMLRPRPRSLISPQLFFYSQCNDESGYARDDFLQSLLSLKSSLKLSKLPAHISELSKNYPFQKRRFFAVGAPGSGNMIFLRICNEILGLRDFNQERSKNDAVGKFFEKQALFYMAFVRARIRAALKPFLICDSIGPEGFGRCFYQAEVSRKILKKDSNGESFEFFISGLPLKHQCWANPLHSSHSCLPARDLEEFDRSNMSVIHIIRHPLDNLLSIVSKVAFYLAPSSLRHRDVFIFRLLNTEPWFFSLFDALLKHYENICDNLQSLKIIKYEDLYQDPGGVVRRLSIFLNKPIPTEVGANIWRRLGNQHFSAKGHRWKPGVGKWKFYIPRKYRDYFDQSNLRELCRALGYDFPDFTRLSTRRVSSMPKNSNQRLALEEIRYYFLIKKRPYFRNAKIKLHECAVSELKIGGLSSQVERVCRMFENESLF